jgi:DNA-directed RNA polymerase subunit K/omega
METMEYNDLANNIKIDTFNKYGGGEEDRSVYDESSNEDNLSEKPGDSDDDSEEKQQESDVEAESNDDEDDEDDEDEEKIEKKPIKANVAPVIVDSDEDDDEDDDNEDYLKKFDKELRKNYIVESHPEVLTYNYSEIQALSKVVRDPKTGVIIDEFHKTIPILTKYEKTRILGQRAKQINSGAKPYVPVNPKFEMDGYTIAIKELEQKRLPFIIRRPLPNGASEFWKLEDLQILNM